MSVAIAGTTRRRPTRRDLAILALAALAHVGVLTALVLDAIDIADVAIIGDSLGHNDVAKPNVFRGVCRIWDSARDTHHE